MTTQSQPPAAAPHQWSSETFADISDISQAHWHYEGTPNASQTALRIEFPGHRVSCQLDRQILRAAQSHAALVDALERIASYDAPDAHAMIQIARAALDLAQS